MHRFACIKLKKLMCTLIHNMCTMSVLFGFLPHVRSTPINTPPPVPAHRPPLITGTFAVLPLTDADAHNEWLQVYGSSAGGDANELRLMSTSDKYINVRAHGGSLDFVSTKVTTTLQRHSYNS